MLRRSNLSIRSVSLTAVVLATLVLAGCSDDDDGDGASAASTTTVSFPLTVAQTTNAAVAPGANGQSTFTVDTDTGAISGSAVVSGTTGVPTMAHIHRGAIGVAGDIALELEASGDASATWSAPADAVLSADDLILFEAGELYVNVHTDANGDGELRGQVVDGAPEGTFEFTFTNTSDTQPMTPPVVVMHSSLVSAGVDLFEVGEAASTEIVEIAENGNNTNMVELLSAAAGTSVSDFAVVFSDRAAPGPLLPGQSASVTLTPSDADQVVSVVSMVVCTNDGFSGIDSVAQPTAAETINATIYDAGSEINQLELDYWVPPCGGEGNLGDAEAGTVSVHPGQDGSENPDFDFAAGSQLLEVTVTPN